MSRELLSRAWSAGAGPGDGPLTIDLDSTICETYGLAKECARHHGYTGHAGLSPAAGRGRRHRGRADGPAARGTRQHRPAALDTSCGRRWVGCATPEPGDNSRCGPTAASTPMPWCPPAAKLDVRFSITIRQHKSLRELIEAIPEQDWTAIPYWMDGAADVAETTYTPFQSEPGRRTGAAHRP